MRHPKSGRHFNRDTKARKALMRNLCTSLLESGRITTTEARAKELRRWVERLITTAKDQDVNARRRVSEEVSKPEVVERLFSNLIPRLAERPGGYTRIIRLGQRQGDASQSAILEWVDMAEVIEEPTEAKPAEEAKPEGTDQGGKAKGKKAKAKAGKAEAEAAK